MGSLTTSPRPQIDVPSTVIGVLFEKNAAYGLDKIVLHYSKKDMPHLVIDLWGKDISKTRLDDCTKALADNSFLNCDSREHFEIRINPTFEFDNSFTNPTNYKHWDLTSKVHRKIKSFERLAVPAETMSVWLSRAMPPEIKIIAKYFPELEEIRSTNKHSKRIKSKTVCIVTAYIPEKSWPQLRHTVREFKQKFGVDIVINPTAPNHSIMDQFKSILPNYSASNSRITKDHVFILQGLLKTLLRWKTIGDLSAIKDSSRTWISIDKAHKLDQDGRFRRINIFREDCFCPRIKDGRLQVSVAIPDITVTKPKLEQYINDPIQNNKGNFNLGVKTCAWICDFDVINGKLIPFGNPYRRVIINSAEFEPGDRTLLDNEAYVMLKNALGAYRDESVVRKLMISTSQRIGEFLNNNGYGFLTRLQDETKIEQLKNILQLLGIQLNKNTLKSPVKIANIALYLFQSKQYAYLPLAVSLLSEGSVVTRSKNKEKCNIKVLQGTASEINQIILAAAVDGRTDALPEDVKGLLNSSSHINDAAKVLYNHQEKTKLAALCRIIISYLTNTSPEKAKVSTIGQNITFIKFPGKKYEGILETDQKLSVGDEVLVAAQSFDLSKEKFVYKITNPTST